MTAPNPLTPTSKPGDALAFDALGEAAGTAATYCDLAVSFASLRDLRGASYAMRCAAAALQTASQAAGMVRLLEQGGGTR